MSARSAEGAASVNTGGYAAGARTVEGAASVSTGDNAASARTVEGAASVSIIDDAASAKSEICDHNRIRSQCKECKARKRKDGSPPHR
jgi:hypothetical protein